MPKISPTARRALVEERKAQILTAAAKCFAAKGYERATIAEIAKEAGIAEGSIYNYFKNKGDLLISLPRQAIQPPIQFISAMTAPSSPEEMLTNMVRTMLGTLKKNSHIFRILLSALPSMTKQMKEQYLQQVILYAIGMVEIYFEKQIQQGTFRSDLNSAILARAFIGMFFPTVLLPEILQIEAAKTIDDEEAISTCVRIFLHGVMAEQPPKPKPRGNVPIE